ncbi:MAG: nitroreductase family protein [Thermoguttaceae bacterium]
MSFSDLVHRSRSYRRFDESRALDRQTLLELVDLARHTPSAANRQPLKYLVAWRREQNERIFGHLRWAAALTDWAGPGPGERPTGYVVILGDTTISRQVRWDDAIAAQTILLAATERGLGGTMIGSIDRDGLRAALALPAHLEILLVVALGTPAERVVLHDGVKPDERPYWRDEAGVHHVPKRGLGDVLVEMGEGSKPEA